MLSLPLAISLAVLCLGQHQNDQARAELVGNWRVVGTISEDGHITKTNDSSGKFVITGQTISLYMNFGSEGDIVVWAADYRVEASKTLHVMYQSVTHAPCMSGATELATTFSVHENTLVLDSMVLQKQRP
jgi:hypothetical protein